MLLLAAGCRQAVPVVDATPRAVEADATVNGTVRGQAGVSAIEGRVVELVNVDTNERHRARTDDAGGFTFRVKPGTYRVELNLRDGERLLKAPGVMQVDGSVDANFVVGSRSGGAASRPRGPGYQADPGLGSPIA